MAVFKATKSVVSLKSGEELVNCHHGSIHDSRSEYFGTTLRLPIRLASNPVRHREKMLARSITAMDPREPMAKRIESMVDIRIGQL